MPSLFEEALLFGELITQASESLGGVKTAIDVAKTLRGLFQSGDGSKAGAEASRLAADLQQRLFDLQEQHMAIRERLLELEKVANRRKRFAAEKKRYALKETYPRSFAYVSKEGEHGAAPTHYLCAHCFEKDERCLLQLQERDFHVDLMVCHCCKAVTHVANDHKPEILTVRSRRGGGWMAP